MKRTDNVLLHGMKRTDSVLFHIFKIQCIQLFPPPLWWSLKPPGFGQLGDVSHVCHM